MPDAQPSSEFGAHASGVAHGPTVPADLPDPEAQADEHKLIARLSPSGSARTRLELAEEIIVYEDSDLLIVDKPAPLPTGASAHKSGLTLELATVRAIWSGLAVPAGQPAGQGHKRIDGIGAYCACAPSDAAAVAHARV